MAKLGKKRQLSGDERDDSEPEVKQKKAKTDKRAKETSKSSSSEEPFWQLSKNRRVSVNKFNKSLLVNVREYYEKDGQVLPGKKGISLTVEQYKELLKFIPEINAQLRKEGEDLGDAEDGEGGERQVAETLLAVEKSKKPARKKANIEATSDEDSD